MFNPAARAVSVGASPLSVPAPPLGVRLSYLECLRWLDAARTLAERTTIEPYLIDELIDEVDQDLTELFATFAIPVAAPVSERLDPELDAAVRGSLASVVAAIETNAVSPAHTATPIAS